MAKAKKIKRLRVVEPPPFYDPERDGITQGILSRFKTCRQSARDSLTGWTGRYPSFPLVYGSLTHYVLERAYTRRIQSGNRAVPKMEDVLVWLDEARAIWKQENPAASELSVNIFEESYMKNAAILPLYFRFWKTDFTAREWVKLEQEFRIPIHVSLPNGRTVATFMRGKIDGVFRTPQSKKNPRAIRLFETKTRTQINEDLLIDTMPFNLQTSFYLVALWMLMDEIPKEVEMNIIRKTALRQGKKEELLAYERRIIADIRDRPDWYFVRMGMTVDPADVRRMKDEIQELMKDFLMWWYGHAPHYRNDNACMAWNRPCDMLKKCARNDTTQLFKRDRVFSELEEI